jgi:glycosyltransferase involved in cell wall biosynthesis
VKILHVVPSYAPAWRYGGPIRSVAGLAAAQAAAGDEVAVFTTDADGPGSLAVPVGEPVVRDGVRVIYFARQFPHRIYRSPAMGRTLDERVGDFDVVHLHSVFLWPTGRAARAARRAGVPYLVSPRGMLVEELIAKRGTLRKRLWIRLFERRTLAGAAALVATSGLEARDIERLGLDLVPVRVVPNGVGGNLEEGGADVAGASGLDSVIAAGSFALFLGRLSRKKNLDLLVRAAAGVPGIRLVIAGGDEEDLGPALDRLAAELGVSDRVARVGEVVGAAKQRLLAMARVLVLPSTSENFGNVVLESLAEGRPVVVSPGVGAREIVESSRGGWVVEPEPAALAEALARVVADPEEADRRGAEGRRVVLEQFGWEKIAARMRTIYDEAVRTSRAAR